MEVSCPLTLAQLPCLPLVSPSCPAPCTVCLMRVNKPTCLSLGPKSSQWTFLTTAVMLPAPGAGLHHRAGSPPGGLKGQLTDSWFQLCRTSGLANCGDSRPGLT